MWPNPQFPVDLVTFTEKILKGSVIQTDKALINKHVFQKYPEISHSNYPWFCSYLPVKIAGFLNISLLFHSFCCLFYLQTKLYRSITRTAMNAKNSVFVIFIEAIIYLSLYNFHDCTFNGKLHFLSSVWIMHSELNFQAEKEDTVAHLGRYHTWEWLTSKSC